MPGKGKVAERPYSPKEARLIGESTALLGATTIDVYLNNRVCWKNIPVKVWEYTISGYDVIKKWLSYREHELFGRGLAVEEVRYVTEMARRIASLILLGPQLDANYRTAAADHAAT